jgi:phage terminase large subunit-like protein
MLTPQEIARNSIRRAGYETKSRHSFVYDDVVDFLEHEMYIPETPGLPMVLEQEQRDVLRAMSQRSETGFLFSTWLFSMPKKSAKTTLGAGVALWQAWRVGNGEIYIIGNDLKQADNRMAQAIRYCVEHNPRMRERVIVTTSKYTIKLDNGTKIESIPVDPRGEAGMNPTGLFWTEAWGAMGSRAELLWTEAALSPTRAGESFKFVESYAGFSGESLILERLHENIVKNGVPHPSIPEVYTTGSSIAYWCTRRYLPWQTSESGQAYYRQEAIEKTPQEFSRIHENQWSTSDDVFVPAVWWSNCQVDALPPIRPGQGMVLGLDGGLRDDCFAVVLVSKDGDYVDVRECHVWYPPSGGVVDFSAVEAELIRIFDQYNVESVRYDETHLAYLVQRLEHRSFWQKFDQGRLRTVSDKMLYDMIRERHIRHTGDVVLTRHITDANRKPEDENKLRLIKRNDKVKIDAAVACSMAAYQIMQWNM